MFEMLSRSDRRSFLRDAGLMFAAMHTPSLASGAIWKAGAAMQAPQSSKTPPRATTPVHYKRIDLLSNRMDEQRRFYTKLLQFPLVEETSDSFTVQTGATQMRFIDDRDEHESVLCHFAFNIPENQLESAMAWVQERWPLLRHKQTGKHVVHFRNINAHSVYWYDPSGHLVEFIAQHNLPNAKDGDFDITNLIATCEIGLVTPDVVGTCEEITRKTGLEVRASNRGNTVFAPTGDPYGYFIVVKQNRTWLMTDIDATLVPIGVTMAGKTPGKVNLKGIPFEINIVA
ncbi:MAG: VOC family protein [Planctomycetota bacterium]|nr:VOC family protein [Planctomycetota bacterium]